MTLKIGTKKIPGEKLVLCILLTLMSCKKRHYSDQLNSQPKVSAELDFCTEQSEQSPLWSAEKVQLELQKLIDTGNFKKSGLSAYAETYKAMTAERDAERCKPGGALAPHSPQSGRVNSVLADLMSKGLVLSQTKCIQTFQDSSVRVPNIGSQLCEINYRAVNERWTALELSMASTAVYLTSVMGIAISTLPHIDALWLDTPHDSLEKRISALKVSFKPTFDSFNVFLSDNLHTVAQVLLKEKRIECSIFELAARAVGLSKAPKQLFKEIRDKTFQLGLELSRTWPKGLHPLTAGEPYWNVEKVFERFATEPPVLRALYDHGNQTVDLLKNPLLKIFKGKDTTQYVTEQGFACDLQK
ncbi:MAG: hypothetical protein RJB13_1407 [Pseudomonadota bacterium]